MYGGKQRGSEELVLMRHDESVIVQKGVILIGQTDVLDDRMITANGGAVETAT